MGISASRGTKTLAWAEKKIDRLSAKGTIVQPYLNMPKKIDIQKVWGKKMKGWGKA